MSNRTCYLLAFDDACGSPEDVESFLDSAPEVLNWHTCLPNSYFVVSEHDADELKSCFREFAGARGRFLIANMTETERNGWLPKSVWNLMRHPVSSEEEHVLLVKRARRP